jgi:hypothetical protein
MTPNSFYNSVVDFLKSGVVDITMSRMDGSQYILRATLSPGYIPESRDQRHFGPMLTETAPLKLNVWDVDMRKWTALDFGRIVRATPSASGNMSPYV